MDKYGILKQYFGYDTFRDGQECLIDSILSGRDVLGIMPTGAGKSLCYQVPALLMKGITLVISPLISLMKDQVSSLNQSGVLAAYLNSSLTYGQYRKALEYAKAGRYPIIYVAPERLLTPEFLDFALEADIAMVAVDEAHCVSQWGQDFRPSYLRITEFIHQLPRRPVVSAFTATATSEVRDDMIQLLQLRQPKLLTTGFDRPNLYFEVQMPGSKYGAVTDYLKNHREESGIIYCLTRKVVEEVCEKLVKDGYSATRYHAGLTDRERQENQEDFIYDRCRIMVATNAFGMGIDKSNVRFVLHYNMPKNMESYYQEAGRAGRDGEPAECILYYGSQDVVTNQLFIENNRDNEELDQTQRALVQERDRERLKQMTFYCFTQDCLRNYILRYFGEQITEPCGSCGNCLQEGEQVEITEAARDLLGCIKSSGQRYGINAILETLHGASTAKIRQYRMDENPYYGSQKGLGIPYLRQIFQTLLLKGYVRLTEDAYTLVKLTEAGRAFLDREEALFMKEPRVPEKAKKEKKAKQKKTVEGSFSEQEEGLFEQLRSLRLSLAREEKVPPYLVFSDKTLVQMCIRRPKTREEMLEVSGVGAYKYEKYGAQFLEALQKQG